MTQLRLCLSELLDSLSCSREQKLTINLVIQALLGNEISWKYLLLYELKIFGPIK